MYIKRSIYKLLTLLAIMWSLSLSAQPKQENWHLYAIEDFNFFYVHHELRAIEQLTEPFKQELFILQNQLNYHLNNKINLFLINNSAQEDQLLSSRFGHEGSEAGLVEGLQFRVVINTMNSPQEILKSFRQQCGMLIFNEMMYGVSFQDQIRNANLLYLPEWLVEGLEFYLGDQWSTETDNRWRMVYEQTGFDHFSKIPSKYDALKGASFIKFITDNYGLNSLPTVLYMARLTRKFHTALYYSFQRGPSEVFREWKEYYSMAYLQDQRKRIPVGGIQYPEEELLDLLVVNTEEHYALLQGVNRVKLKHYKNGESKTIFHLDNKYKPLPAFNGSIQKMGKRLFLFVQQDQELIVLSPGFKKEPFSLRASSIKKIGQSIYVLDAGFEESSLYRIYDENMGFSLSKELSMAAYVQDFVRDYDGVWIILKSDWNGYRELWRIGEGDSSLLFETSYDLRQLILNKDGSLLFNMNKNGIYNGVRLDVEKNEIQYLTDYRSDIAFHQSSDSFFAEYVRRLDRSALYVTDPVVLDDLYVYDSITPTYFSVHRELDYEEVVDPSYEPDKDSLPNYVFISPIPPSKDFTLSNYDSLKKLEDERRRKEARLSVAPDNNVPSSFYVQVYNELLMTQDLPFGSAAEFYLPNALGIRFGGGISNQFNTRNLSMDYVGFRFWQNRDVALSYSLQKGELPFSLGYLHRQRLSLINDQDVNKDRTNLVRMAYGLQVSSGLRLIHRIEFRHDEEIHLGTNLETLNQGSRFKSRISTTLGLNWSHKTENAHWNKQWQFELKSKIQPYLMTNKDGWGSNFTAHLDFSKHLKEALRFKGSVSAGTSVGTDPTYFVLGGTRTDAFAQWEDRTFSEYKTPAYYRMVYGVRGFTSNYRNGNSFGVLNAELRWRVLDKVVKRPLFSELLDQFELICFADLGTSLYGRSIYDDANALNSETFESPGGSFTVEVRNIKNPLIGSTGVGIRSSLYSYHFGLDYALGIENSNLRSGVFHLSLGRSIF